MRRATDWPPGIAIQIAGRLVEWPARNALAPNIYASYRTRMFTVRPKLFNFNET